MILWLVCVFGTITLIYFFIDVLPNILEKKYYQKLFKKHPKVKEIVWDFWRAETLLQPYFDEVNNLKYNIRNSTKEFEDNLCYYTKETRQQIEEELETKRHELEDKEEELHSQPLYSRCIKLSIDLKSYVSVNCSDCKIRIINYEGTRPFELEISETAVKVLRKEGKPQ